MSAGTGIAFSGKIKLIVSAIINLLMPIFLGFRVPIRNPKLSILVWSVIPHWSKMALKVAQMLNSRERLPITLSETMGPLSYHAAPPHVRARMILDEDRDKVAELLAKGFGRRSHGFWCSFLIGLRDHATPPGRPRYGYLLENNGIPIGVILMISTLWKSASGETVRCNLSSWYVDPGYRIYAPLLASQATKFPNTTYLNIDPAKHTHGILSAQGFRRYVNGQFCAIPSLSSGASGQTKIIDAHEDPGCPFEPFERKLLLDHVKYGCISVWCVARNRAYPFVFVRRGIKRIIPCAQLVYCRSIDEFVRFARPLGLFLMLRGLPLVMLDANGTIPGLVGKYFDNLMPKYFKGGAQPPAGDAAYSETAMFGV